METPAKDNDSSQLMSESGDKTVSAQEVDLVLRKIKQQITQKGQSTSTNEMVPYTKILGEATKCELFQFFVGHLCAALMGLIIPVFQFFISDLFDSFNPTNSKEQ